MGKHRAPSHAGFGRFVVAGLIAAGPLAAVVPHAGAAPLPATYTAGVTPTAVPVSSTTTLTFTISNAIPPGSLTPLNTATIAVPSGWSVTGLGTPVAPLLQTWTAQRVGSLITLSGAGPSDALLPGQQVSLPVTALASAVAGAYTWSTTASNTLAQPPESFTISGPQPVVTVAGRVVFCEPNVPCDSGQLATPTTRVRVVASAGPDSDILTVSVGGAFPTPACTAFTRKSDVLTHDVTGTARSSTATLTLPPASAPLTTAVLAKYGVCLAKDVPFTTRSGAQAQYDAGTDSYQGVLPDCGPGVPPCLQSRSQVGGRVTLVYLAPAGDPRSIGGINI